MLPLSGHAQRHFEGKPEENEFTFELNYGLDPIFDGGMSSPLAPRFGLKSRGFYNEKKAFTAQFFFNWDAGGNEWLDATSDWSSVYLDLRLGGEHHFKGTKRLSPYLGYHGIIGAIFNDYARQEFGTVANQQVLSAEYFTHSGETILGVGLTLGADYYISNKFFVGVGANLATAAIIPFRGGGTTYTYLPYYSEQEYVNNERAEIFPFYGFLPMLTLKLGWFYHPDSE